VQERTSGAQKAPARSERSKQVALTSYVSWQCRPSQLVEIRLHPRCGVSVDNSLPDWRNRDYVVMHPSAAPHTCRATSKKEQAILNLSMFGVRVEIRIDDSVLVEPIVKCLPPGCSTDTSARIDRTYEFLNTPPGWSPKQGALGDPNGWYLLAGRSLIWHSSNAGALCDRFQADLELFLAVRARTHAVVDAGVVGWQGRAIVIPARNSSGKTTLVAALIREGAEYYSDQYAVIDPNGLVSPFPRPLSIRPSPQSRQACTAEELGGVTGRTPLPIGCIVATEYRPGAVWQPQRLTPGEAVLALLSNSAAARYQSGFLLRTFRMAVRGAVALSGPRGDATDLARALLNNPGEDLG
jgi:hypothetical protein